IDMWLADKFTAKCTGSADETGAQEDKAAGFGGGTGSDVGEDEVVVVVVEVRAAEWLQTGDREVFHADVGAGGNSADAAGVRGGVGVVVAVIVVVLGRGVAKIANGTEIL